MRTQENVELFRAFTVEEIRSRRELQGSGILSCIYYFFNGYYKKL
jgi:hypothetical protein